MYRFKKIVLILMVAVLPFTTLFSQQPTKKKSATYKSSSKINSKKKKSTKKKKTTTANKKINQTVAANPMASTLKLANTINADTSIPKTVTVTSVFKPSLHNAAKINFTAATPIIDSSKLILSYQIPSQNLFFTYQPISIKPVALQTDSIISLQHEAFIKLGFGNYSTPYIEAAATVVNQPAALISVHGKYTASKGNIVYQEFNKASVDANGDFELSKRNSLNTTLFFNHTLQYKYGGVNSNFNKDQLQQAFNHYGFTIGLHSKGEDSLGISYHPTLGISNFTDNHGANEFNMIFNGSVKKSFTKFLSFDLGVKASITNLKQSLTIAAYNTVNNNIYAVPVAIQFKTPNTKLNIGMRPTWDNNSFSLLPNFTAESRLATLPMALELGWIGYLQKNTYQSLSSENPFIFQPGLLQNTKFSEQYIGIKGSSNKHLTYEARFSLLKVNNYVLFVNDTLTNNRQTFLTLYEPEVKGFKIHGEIAYTFQEIFFTGASINITNFTNQQSFAKPWGLIPLSINAFGKYKITKDFSVKADLFFWDGAYYRNPATLASEKLPPAIDFNIGTEFTVAPKVNIWVQMNNVFNNRYQRWNQYEVLGFNVLGGIVYSFR
jgi:hypothetical protein